MEYAQVRQFPLITAIVVNKEIGQPGKVGITVAVDIAVAKKADAGRGYHPVPSKFECDKSGLRSLSVLILGENLLTCQPISVYPLRAVPVYSRLGHKLTDACVLKVTIR